MINWRSHTHVALVKEAMEYFSKNIHNRINLALYYSSCRILNVQPEAMLVVVKPLLIYIITGKHTW